MPPLYYNHDLPGLRREQDDAQRAGVDPVKIPSDEFSALAATGVRMIFVISPDGQLVAAPRRHRGEYITHAVLADGGPVLAAGEFDVEFEGASMVVSWLDNMSGHYRPDADSLVVAVEAFEAAEICVRPDAVLRLDFDA